MEEDVLQGEELVFARQVHLALNTAFYRLVEREQMTIPCAVLGCREFLAECLARVSAVHHTPEEAEDAFRQLVAALRNSLQRNIALLRKGKDGKDLSWCPTADHVLEHYYADARKAADRRKRGR